MKTMPLASPHTYRNALRGILGKTVILSGLLAAIYPAQANDVSDIGKLMHNGQYPEALSKTDAVLAKHPRDAQMRFVKGLILAEQNKAAEAIAIFSKLTEDFPDLPEPYNNLAVLYAANGQYDKARSALDMAIRTNPTYATALENLGDIYAKLASQAYDKALQIDPGSNVPTPTPAPDKKQPDAVSETKSEPKAVDQIDEKRAAAEKAKADKAAEKAAKLAEKQAKQAKEAAEQTADSTRGEKDKAAILSTVNNWAKAWSDMDVKSYLASYGNDFVPPKGQSRKQWSEERRDRIEEKGHISVKVEAPQVTIKNDTATVRFRQIYNSNRLTVDSRKTLILTKQGNKWLIKQERSGG